MGLDSDPHTSQMLSYAVKVPAALSGRSLFPESHLSVPRDGEGLLVGAEEEAAGGQE